MFVLSITLNGRSSAQGCRRVTGSIDIKEITHSVSDHRSKNA